MHPRSAESGRPLDAFTRAYLTAALFTDTPEELQRSGEFQEIEPWTIANMADEAIAYAVNDCARFQELHADRIGEEIERAGRDLWYTRNRHGCGFWDGDWPEADGDALTAAAHHLGETDLYMGDDGRLYFTR